MRGISLWDGWASLWVIPFYTNCYQPLLLFVQFRKIHGGILPWVQRNSISFNCYSLSVLFNERHFFMRWLSISSTVLWVKLSTSSLINSNHDMLYTSRISISTNLQFHDKLRFHPVIIATTPPSLPFSPMSSISWCWGSMCISWLVWWTPRTCFQYSEAVIIAAAYPNYYSSGKDVCVVLIKLPILDK